MDSLASMLNAVDQNFDTALGHRLGRLDYRRQLGNQK